MESIIDFVDCLAILKKYNKEQLFLQLFNENKELKNENKELKNENNKNESLLFIKNIINTVCIIELENDNKNFKELNISLINKKVSDSIYEEIELEYKNAKLKNYNNNFKELNKKLKEKKKKLIEKIDEIEEKNINIKKQNKESDKEESDKEESDKEESDKEESDKEESDKEESDKEESDKEDNEEAENAENDDIKEKDYLKVLENENKVLKNENKVLENENNNLKKQNKFLENFHKDKILENEILVINNNFLLNFENYLNQIINFYINRPIDKIIHWNNGGEDIYNIIATMFYEMRNNNHNELRAYVDQEKLIWHKEFVEHYQKILDDYRNKKFYIINSFNIFIKSKNNIDIGFILFINNYGCVYGFNIIRDQWDKIICCNLAKFYMKHQENNYISNHDKDIEINKHILNNNTFDYEYKLSPNKIKLISKLPFNNNDSKEKNVLFSYLNFIYTNG